VRDENSNAFREAIRADYAATVVRITKEFENWRRDEKALFEEFFSAIRDLERKAERARS
jgi:uncharacterized protein Yka (UPF0111/DUF47 family)